jgi:hypothetical protein
MISIERYLVVDIGCLECGEKTVILGAFESPEAAKALFPDAKLASNLREATSEVDSDWGGSGMAVIFDLAEELGTAVHA